MIQADSHTSDDELRPLTLLSFGRWWSRAPHAICGSRAVSSKAGSPFCAYGHRDLSASACHVECLVKRRRFQLGQTGGELNYVVCSPSWTHCSAAASSRAIGN